MNATTESTPSTRSPRRRVLTLIDLMAVMVILGIVVEIVTPKFGRSGDARLAAAKAQIAAFGTALDAFKVDNGFYPPGTNGLNDLVQLPLNAPNWKGPYMQGDVPFDPWMQPYVYEWPGKHNPSGYDLCSLGPPGGKMIIANWRAPGQKPE